MQDKWSLTRWVSTIAGVVIVLSIVVYVTNEPTTTEDVQESIGDSIDTTADFVEEKIDQFKSLDFSERDSLASRIESRLADAKKRLVELQNDSRDVSRESVAELKESIEELEEELQELRDAGEKQWQDIRDDTIEKYEELSKRLKDTMS